MVRRLITTEHIVIDSFCMHSFSGWSGGVIEGYLQSIPCGSEENSTYHPVTVKNLKNNAGGVVGEGLGVSVDF